MGHEIHAIKKDGEWLFRTWSTFVDNYLCEETDEEDLKFWMLGNELSECARRFFQDWPRRVKRAKERGTSRIDSRGRSTTEWDTPLPDKCCWSCHWHRSESDDTPYGCACDDSPHLGEETEDGHVCDFWEES